MNVGNLMTSNPATCSPQESLAAAAAQMWNNDCGMLPVIEGSTLAGVITDRDIAMGVTLSGKPATAISVAKVMSRKVAICDPEDPIEAALAAMADHQVRRLPVVSEGRLVGLLSLNDVALEAGARVGGAHRPTYGQVAKALQAISAHHSMALAP